jgi:hypothetical protein
VIGRPNIPQRPELELICAVTSLADDRHLTRAIDLNAGGTDLLITLLLAHGAVTISV